MIRAIFSVYFIFLAATAWADTQKYVGGWNGAGADNVYTSLMFLGGQQVEYCFADDCYGWAVKGNTNKTFSFTGPAGEWVFKRIEADTIEGTFTNPSGGVYTATFTAH